MYATGKYIRICIAKKAAMRKRRQLCVLMVMKLQWKGSISIIVNHTNGFEWVQLMGKWAWEVPARGCFYLAIMLCSNKWINRRIKYGSHELTGIKTLKAVNYVKLDFQSNEFYVWFSRGPAERYRKIWIFHLSTFLISDSIEQSAQLQIWTSAVISSATSGVQAVHASSNPSTIYISNKKAPDFS